MAIDGLTSYLFELGNLPLALKAEAAGLVLDTAEAAAAEIRTAYPEQSRTQYGTGNLARGVKVKVVSAGQFGAAARVASTAPHAYFYEHGTVKRQTSKGWNRGISGAHPTLIPIAIRRRHEMYRRLAELLEQRNITVTINAA